MPGFDSTSTKPLATDRAIDLTEARPALFLADLLVTDS